MMDTNPEAGPQRESDITTSFLLSNLHCPSCVSHINGILSSLQPPPSSISPWLASSWVIIKHDPALPDTDIQKALEDGGFDICDISSEDGVQPSGGETGYLDRFVDKWSNSHQSKPRQNKHLDNCDLCRGEVSGKDGMSSSSKPQVPPVMLSDKDLTSVVVESGEEDVWQASLAVGGMTCAACVVTITEELGKKNWVKNVVVNLIGNSATVEFFGEQHKNDLVESFEDIGYDATIDNIINQSQKAAASSISRTVEIKVDGMFCDHCPPRIITALENFGDRVKIEKPLTIQNPIMKITYTPQSPSFTIRSIMAAISTVHEALLPTIYHPPTLEERSRKIHARERKRILIRVILTFLIAIPTFVIGIVLMSLVSSNNSARRYFKTPSAGRVSRAQWALFALATPVWFLCADVFHIRAMKEVRALWRPGSTTPIFRRFYRFGSMNMLMSLGTSIAYLSSVAQLIAAGARHSSIEPNDDSFYFDSVVFLTLFLLIGRLIEAYSKSRTGDAVLMLGKLRPTEAILVETRSPGNTDSESFTTGEKLANSSPEPTSGQEISRSVPVDFLEFGDIVRIAQGASPPCDGIILSGMTRFDESSLTGESKPTKKNIGDEVFSGTVNKESPITIRITGVAGSSMLDQIVRAVREGQTRRAPMERIADSLTAYFVPFVTLVAILTWIVWLALGYSGALPRGYIGNYAGGWVAWSLQFAISVFVVACPCGLALAAPTALFVGGGLAAQHGILVKGGGEAFEKASRLDCVVFDKTGTLTCGGEPIVTDHWLKDTENKEVLDIVMHIEGNSSHTIAKALVSFCSTKSTQHDNKVLVENIEEISGKGMKGTYHRSPYDLREVIIGNEALIEDNFLQIPSDIQNLLEQWKSQGKSVALAAMTVTQPEEKTIYELVAAFAISDPIRSEAPAVIKALHERGTDVWMLSGDNTITANAIGLQLNIPSSNIIADVLPTQKADSIRHLQRTLKASSHATKRATIAMVGDGINDSPALAAADIGIAIGSGSDIAISSAMFVLVSSDLEALVTLLDLSRAVFRRIKFNFGWALVYNLIALPVSAGVFYPIVSSGSHVRLAPVWASLAMAASSISVVMSSLALRSRIPRLGFQAKKVVERTESEEP